MANAANTALMITRSSVFLFLGGVAVMPSLRRHFNDIGFGLPCSMTPLI
jgi:hypothetical protein